MSDKLRTNHGRTLRMDDDERPGVSGFVLVALMGAISGAIVTAAIFAVVVGLGC